MNTLFFTQKKSFFALFIGILLTGCGIPSVHPLYEPSDLKADASLPGVWQHQESNSRFHVMRIGDLDRYLNIMGDTIRTSANVRTEDYVSGYVDTDPGILDMTGTIVTRGLENLYFVQSESDRSEMYLVGVVELGGNRYLDFKKLDLNISQFSYPVHLFMKSTITGDTLTMHMFSENWLKEQIRNRQIRIKYEVNDDENYILTAPTNDLKKFVEKYGSISEAYRNTRNYVKVSDSPRFVFEDLEE